MSDEVLRLSAIGQVLRNRWRLLLALAALGAVAGLVMSLFVKPTYEASSTVLLQGSRSEDEVLTEAQIAMSLVVVNRAVTKLGWDVDGADVIDSVAAEVPAGNVIRITATASSASAARALTAQVTEEYIFFTTEIATRTANATVDALQQRKATLERRMDDSNRRITELQSSFGLLDPRNPSGAEARAELERERSIREEAVDQLDAIEQGISAAQAQESVTRNSIRIIEFAVPPGSALPPTPVQLVAGGGALFAVLGAVAAIGARYTDRRLRRKADIAAAVGAPVLGVVAAPADTAAMATENDEGSAERSTARTSRIAALLREEPPPAHDIDPALEHLRYDRVLDQLLAKSANARVLVVVLEGDVLAGAAVAQLASTAAATGRPVSVVPDGSRLSGAVKAAVVESRTHREVAVVASGAMDPSPPRVLDLVLPVVVVPAFRPTIPPQFGVSATLLVVTSGTATGAELLGVSQACQDANLAVTGVLLVRTAADGDESEPPEWTSAPMTAPTPVAASNGHLPGNGYRYG